MKKSNLVQLFIALDKKDLGALRKFIRSPFHNRREDVTALFDYIDHHLSSKKDALNKVNAFKALFPSEDYDDRKMCYLMSYLLKRVEQYLIHAEINKQPVLMELTLSRAYRKLGLEKGLRRSLTDAETIQNKSTFRDLNFYENQYQLEQEKHFYHTGTTKRLAPRNLQSLNQAIDISYLTKKLKYSCSALAHQGVYNIEYDTGLLPLVLDYLEESEWLKTYPAFSLYYYYFKSATSENHTEYFTKLKKGLFEHDDIFEQEEKRALYLLAINYCIQRFNKGDLEYLSEAFDLYKAGLKNKILLQQGGLSRFAFKNIAGIAIRLGAFDWTKKFIETYSQKVELEHRENYTFYNYAKLYYAQKKYSAAMVDLQKVEYEDLFLNIDAKILLLKIYYELREMEALESAIQSLKRFLQRKKVMRYHQENYSNTLYFLNRLLKLNPFDKKEKQNLSQEIKQTKILGEKEWLLAQLGMVD